MVLVYVLSVILIRYGADVVSGVQDGGETSRQTLACIFCVENVFIE